MSGSPVQHSHTSRLRSSHSTRSRLIMASGSTKLLWLSPEKYSSSTAVVVLAKSRAGAGFVKSNSSSRGISTENGFVQFISRAWTYVRVNRTPSTESSSRMAFRLGKCSLNSCWIGAAMNWKPGYGGLAGTGCLMACRHRFTARWAKGLRV